MSGRSTVISASYFSTLCEVLAASRIDVVHLLRMAAIESDRLTRAGAGLTVAEVEAFVAAARRLTGRSDLAFEFGRGIKMNSHDQLGYAMMSCETADQVLRLVSRHYHLITTLFTLRYRRQGRIGEAIYTPAAGLSLDMLHFFLEAIAVSHQNQVALTIGERLTGYDIHVSIPEPAHRARYFGLSPARFHFDERAVPGVRVVMDSELLDAPLPMASARVVRHIEDRLHAQRSRTMPVEGKWGDYVTMMLRETQGAQLTLEEIARRLELSSRTVARALQKESLEFRELSQRVMYERACELMAANGATVSGGPRHSASRTCPPSAAFSGAWPAWRRRRSSVPRRRSERRVRPAAGVDRAEGAADYLDAKPLTTWH